MNLQNTQRKKVIGNHRCMKCLQYGHYTYNCSQDTSYFLQGNSSQTDNKNSNAQATSNNRGRTHQSGSNQSNLSNKQITRGNSQERSPNLSNPSIESLQHHLRSGFQTNKSIQNLNHLSSDHKTTSENTSHIDNTHKKSRSRSRSNSKSGKSDDESSVDKKILTNNEVSKKGHKKHKKKNRQSKRSSSQSKKEKKDTCLSSKENRSKLGVKEAKDTNSSATSNTLILIEPNVSNNKNSCSKVQNLENNSKLSNNQFKKKSNISTSDNKENEIIINNIISSTPVEPLILPADISLKQLPNILNYKTEELPNERGYAIIIEDTDTERTDDSCHNLIETNEFIEVAKTSHTQKLQDNQLNILLPLNTPQFNMNSLVEQLQSKRDIVEDEEDLLGSLEEYMTS